MAAHVHGDAQKHVAGVVGMQRIDLRVLGAGEIVDVVALNRLVEKGQAKQQDDRDD